jgi:hypothetical protein
MAFAFVLDGSKARDSFKMSEEIRPVIETTFKTNCLCCNAAVFYQHSLRMTDSDFYQKIMESFLSHHFKIAAK